MKQVFPRRRKASFTKTEKDFSSKNHIQAWSRLENQQRLLLVALQVRRRWKFFFTYILSIMSIDKIN